MEAIEIRTASIERARQAGITIPDTLPFLEIDTAVREQGAICDRLLCMTAVAAASYGFNRGTAVSWLEREGLVELLTNAENEFLFQGRGNAVAFQLQVEGMWALAWVIGLVPSFSFWQDCDQRFVTMLPNLRELESGKKLRTHARMRPVLDVRLACDLAYCLHWALRQADLERVSSLGGLKEYVVIERRRSLDWTLSDETWDLISLDT